MPISQAALAALSAAPDTGIGHISRALSQIKQSKHEEKLMGIRNAQLSMQMEQHEQTTELNKYKLEQAQSEQALDQAKQKKAFVNAWKETVQNNPDIMQNPIAMLGLQRQLAEGKNLPDYVVNDVLTPQHMMQMEADADNHLAAYADKEDTDAWQYKVMLARKIQAGEATEGDVAAFEALKPAPGVQVNVPGPGGQGRMAAWDIYDHLEVDGESLKGEVDGEEAFITMLDSRAKLLEEQSQAMARREENPALAISYDQAVMQAKQQLIDEGKLKPNEEKEWYKPWESKWKFDPEGKPEGDKQTEQTELPEGLSEQYMNAALQQNGLEDTPENRELIIEAWRNR